MAANPALPAPTVLVLCSLGDRFEASARRDGFLMRSDGLSDDDLSRLADIRVVVLRSGIALDRPLLDRMPALRHVIRAGSGIDNIDTDALEARSISLTLRKAASAQAVAEIAFAALISLARRMPEGSAALRHGEWAKSRLVGDEISRLDVAIWGAGPVGRACATSLQDQVRSVHFVAWPSAPDVSTIDRREAIASADVHLLALPLRPTTRSIIDAKLLEAMAPRRPYIINIGRADLMDRDAVIDALGRDRSRGVFLDAIDAHDIEWVRPVTEAGPMNLLVTPHLGAQRADVLDGLGDWVLERLADVRVAD